VRNDWFPDGEMVVRGNLGPSTLKGKLCNGEIREVVKAVSYGVAFRTAEGGESWLRWPKASSYRDTPTGFEIDLNDKGTFEKVIAYEFV
jgi:hypothetical protein